MGCFMATPTTTGMSACTKLPEIIRHTNPKATNCPSVVPQKRSHQEVRKRCSVKRSPSGPDFSPGWACIGHRQPQVFPETRGRTSCRDHAAGNDSRSDIRCPASLRCAPQASRIAKKLDLAENTIYCQSGFEASMPTLRRDFFVM